MENLNELWPTQYFAAAMYRVCWCLMKMEAGPCCSAKELAVKTVIPQASMKDISIVLNFTKVAYRVFIRDLISLIVSSQR